MPLARMIQPALPDAAFVAPNAPSQILRMAAAHQWWPIETFSMAEHAAGAAAAALDAFITHELKEVDLPSDRLLIPPTTIFLYPPYPAFGSGAAHHQKEAISVAMPAGSFLRFDRRCREPSHR